MLRLPTGVALRLGCCVAFRCCGTKVGRTDDALSSLLDELDQCELNSTSVKTSPTTDKGGSSTATKKQASTPPIGRREKTEILRQAQLKKLIHEADREIEFLETEQRRTDAHASVGSLTPAKSSDQFFTGSEQVLEKSPQHFVPSTDSEAEVEKLPQLRHSGAVAVVTIVGKVTKVTGTETTTDRASFLLEYDLPAECRERKGLVAAVTHCPTLCAFVHENVEVGDVVHVLGQLVPSHEPGVLATVLVPQNGGSVSTVLRPNS